MRLGGNCVWCLVKIVIFMGLGGANRWRDILKLLFGGSRHKGGDQFFWGCCHYVILLFWNFIVSLTRYCKSPYRIPLFTILLLFNLLCIYWEIKNLVASKLVTLVYPVAKFDKTNLHRALTLYNRKTGKTRTVIKNVLKLRVQDKH